jgi:hypothetical protein
MKIFGSQHFDFLWFGKGETSSVLTKITICCDALILNYLRLSRPWRLGAVDIASASGMEVPGSNPTRV